MPSSNLWTPHLPACARPFLRFIYLTLDSGEAGYQQSVLAEQLLQLLPRSLGMSQQEAVELLEAGGRRATDTVRGKGGVGSGIATDGVRGKGGVV